MARLTVRMWSKAAPTVGEDSDIRSAWRAFWWSRPGAVSDDSRALARAEAFGDAHGGIIDTCHGAPAPSGKCLRLIESD